MLVRSLEEVLRRKYKNHKITQGRVDDDSGLLRELGI
jgi:hypothetical protein